MCEEGVVTNQNHAQGEQVVFLSLPVRHINGEFQLQ